MYTEALFAHTSGVEHLPSLPDLLAANAAAHPLRVALHPKPINNKMDVLAANGNLKGGITYQTLNAWVDALAERFMHAGIAPGQRVLLLVPPGPAMVAAAYALMRTGAVLVAIDSGLGLKKFIKAARRTQPTAAVGVPAALVLARGLVGVKTTCSVATSFASPPSPHFFNKKIKNIYGNIKRNINGDEGAAGGADDNGGKVFEGVGQVKPSNPHHLNTSHTALEHASALAAILFTSGSTGAPKGVCYTQGMLAAQVSMLKKVYPNLGEDTDMPLLPLFALLNPAFGATTVLPPVNPRRPITLKPQEIINLINARGATRSFGAPPLWQKIAQHAKENNTTLPTLKTILMAGAPVSPSLVQLLQTVAPGATVNTPYGATESLPVTSISGPEILARAGRAKTGAGIHGGVCVGQAAAGAEVAIVGAQHPPAEHICPGRNTFPANTPGEITVSSPATTHVYDALPGATQRAKLQDATGRTWHRMGDIGYTCPAGNLWFLGRKVECVHTAAGTFYPVNIEAVANALPAVHQSAFIGLKNKDTEIYGVPAMIIQPNNWKTFKKENLSKQSKTTTQTTIAAAINAHAPGLNLQPQHVFFMRQLPTDIRHNAKIHRLALARTFAKRL